VDGCKAIFKFLDDTGTISDGKGVAVVNLFFYGIAEP